LEKEKRLTPISSVFLKPVKSKLPSTIFPLLFSNGKGVGRHISFNLFSELWFERKGMRALASGSEAREDSRAKACLERRSRESIYVGMQPI